MALRIAERAIEYLGDNGYWDAERPEDCFGPDKPLAEAAMLLHAASPLRTLKPISQLFCNVQLALERRARSSRVVRNIALHPTICLQLSMPHILLGQLGSGNDHVDSVLAASLGATGHRGTEMLPHRLLELAWLRSLWRGGNEQEFEAGERASVLGRPIDLIWGSRDDAYAHTHSLMYFTNFGFAKRQFSRPLTEVLQDSAGLLARSLLLEDFDLAAELLLAWPFTGTPWSPAAIFGVQVLADFEDRIGILLSANGLPAKFERLSGRERTEYALAASYHTAFVMGMLCALALRAEYPLPPRIEGRPVSLASLEEIWRAVPKSDTPWQQSFGRLQPTEKQALAPFLLEIGIIGAARREDFATVHELLQVAVKEGLADVPICGQSAELLSRLARCFETPANTDRSS